MFNFNKTSMALALTSILIFTGCDHNDKSSNDDDPVQDISYTYQITVSNLTSAQPLSPIAAVLHESDALWTLGQPASNELEQLAEGGDNTALLNLFDYSASNGGIVLPGDSSTFNVSIINVGDAKLSISSMLVNTNDAFVGLNAIDLANMLVGDSISVFGDVYDAGTEANNEADGSIPGPADGGTGYLTERDDVNFVAFHQGVVSQDDGLSHSVLLAEHKFDNPAVRFTISRME